MGGKKRVFYSKIVIYLYLNNDYIILVSSLTPCRWFRNKKNDITKLTLSLTPYRQQNHMYHLLDNYSYLKKDRFLHKMMLIYRHYKLNLVSKYHGFDSFV